MNHAHLHIKTWSRRLEQNRVEQRYQKRTEVQLNTTSHRTDESRILSEQKQSLNEIKLL